MIWPITLINWTLIKNTLFGEAYVWYWWVPIILVALLGIIRLLSWIIWAISCIER